MASLTACLGVGKSFQMEGICHMWEHREFPILKLRCSWLGQELARVMKFHCSTVLDCGNHLFLKASKVLRPGE